jgi:hypothetical protein
LNGHLAALFIGDKVDSTHGSIFLHMAAWRIVHAGFLSRVYLRSIRMP